MLCVCVYVSALLWCSVTTNIHLDVLSKPSLAQLSWPKQNALMRKRIVSTSICIWVELETRTYSYLPKDAVGKGEKEEDSREGERECERSLLCFLCWHTQICTKGLLLTNERAGKKCGRIALFFCSRRRQGRKSEEKTQGISQPGHRHAHARTWQGYMPCVLPA